MNPTRNEILLQLIRRTIGIDYTYKHRHLPGSLSALPIIYSIYETFVFGENRGENGIPRCTSKDVFILSKGHAAAAWYAVLEHFGYSPALGHIHPERDPDNGVTATTGSLGHGLPMAVGIALGKKLSGEIGKVHVLLGDAECAEGTTYEALLMAQSWELGNLRVHVDGNQAGCLGKLPLETHRIMQVVTSPFHYKSRIDWRWYPYEKGWGIPSLEGTADHVLDYDLTTCNKFLNEARVPQ